MLLPTGGELACPPFMHVWHSHYEPPLSGWKSAEGSVSRVGETIFAVGPF